MNIPEKWYQLIDRLRQSFNAGKTLAALSLLLSVALWPTQSLAESDAVCAEVKIEINQELTLERQAFDAMMRINNSLDTLSLDNVTIDVLFQDADGNPVLASSDPDSLTAKFFITVDSLQGVDTISGGTILPNTTAEVHWLIIPAAGAADTPTGTVYFIGANLSYSYGGVEETVVVAPDFIRVKPLPQITLDYFLEKDVYGDDAFTTAIEPPVPYTLGVRVQNNGVGLAENLKIESAQPKIVENEQGLLIDFKITDSFVDDFPATPTLLIDFGNIEPGAAKHGRWVMETTLSGQFTEFTASFSHADELGGQLTSLIEGVNTHFLIHDVRVDVLGRDNVRDFLAEDAGVLTVYESDNVDTVVPKSTTANLVFNVTSADDTYYDLTTDVTAGFMYANMVDPFEGAKEVKEVIRSDGKRLPAENAWFSKTRKTIPEDGWDYYFNIFDNASSGVYSVVFSDKTIVQQAPIFQFIPDRTTHETNQVSFIVMASDPDGTVPIIYAENLPVGASFIDQADGTALFDWTPNIGQEGLYEITYRATDGALIGTRKAYIQVNPVWDTDGDGMDDAWEMENFGTLDRDGTGDFDGDGVSDLQEYLDGTNPVTGLTKFWEAPATVDIATTDATNPQVVIAEDGSAISVWSQSDGMVTSIWANSYTPATGWGLTPELLETSNIGNAHSPEIVLDANGNAMAIWLQSDGTRDNLWSNYYTSSVGWGTAALIENDNIGDANYAEVRMATDGTAIALWSQADGTLNGSGQAQANTVMTSRYTVGTGWSVPTRIDSYTPIHAFAIQLSVDALGNVIALWSDTSDGTNYNISTNRYVSGVGWGTAALLRAGALGDIDASPLVSARLAMNANGDAVAVWAEASSPASVWASVYPSATTWGVATLLETSLNTAIEPTVAIDNAGNAIAAFVQFDGSRYVIHANRYSAGAWGIDTLIGTSSTASLNGDSTAPQIAINNSGNATVVWQQSDGVQSNIWANRFDATAVSWEQPLVIETENAGDAENAQIAINTSGEAVVVWQQADGTTSNIQANTYEPDNAGVPNIVPIAFTPVELTVDEKTTVTLDGSASFDQDGLITNYTWTQSSGTPVTLDTGTTATTGIATFVAPALTSSETFVFELTVTDDASPTTTGTASTTVTVNPVNDAPVGVPTITGIATQNQTLTASTSGISDADGLGLFSYQWNADGLAITGATGISLVLSQAEVGALITVTVSYTDGGGTAESVTSASTSPVANVNDAPVGVPTINGIATQNQTLTVNTTGISDLDGLGIFSYQWNADGAAITGATGISHALTQAEVGTLITVTVSYTDGGGTPESLTSASVGPVANVNDAPLGIPTITGIATQNQTLSANTSGISDLDGLGVFSYQWNADGAVITGATGISHVLTQAEVGALITVTVSYTDGGGTPENLTSASAGPVANVNDAPVGIPTITGIATQNQTLTVTTTGISDLDGLGIFSYQWNADGAAITGATGISHALTQAEVGTLITVTVSYTDGGGTPESLTSASVGPVANVNDAPLGIPIITGIATQNQTLSANTSGISDLDGLGVFSYQWNADGAAITSATGVNLVLSQAEVGTLITVTVSYTDGGGTPESVTSASTSPVANVNDAPVGVPTITGIATQNQTLTVTTTGISDLDGLGVFSYQWNADGAVITGATGISFVLTQAEVGSTITVSVSYTDGGSTAESVTSTGVGPIANVNDAPIGAPTIDGLLVAQNETLSANTSGISDLDGLGVFSYQWNADGAAITGATGISHALTQAEVGALITVTVSYTDGGGTPESLTSASVGPVANVNDVPVGVPTITGIATQNQTLTVSTTGISDLDGLGLFSYQWYADSLAITGATGVSFILTQSEVGALITVTVSYTDGGGTPESLASASVGPVIDVNDAPEATITTPTNGSHIQEGDIVTFTGTANDVEDGDISGGLSWSSNLDGVIGTGGSINVGTLSAGLHTITATVTDSGGLSPVSPPMVTITIIPYLINEPFSNGDGPVETVYPDWVVVDEGTISAPSNWIVNAARLEQTSDIRGKNQKANVLPKLGTYLLYTPSTVAPWTDFNLQLTLNSTDDDAIGVMFRYQDSNNYYRFSWDSQRSYRRVVKNVNGTFTLLAEDNVPYVLGQTYNLEITAQGNAVSISIDGIEIFSFVDNSFASGGIAMYAWSNTGAAFDDLVGRAIFSVGLTPPTVSITSPADGSVFTEGDTITFTGIAIDAEDGNITGGLSWSSNIDGVIGTGGSFSLSTLSVDSHTITASVTDSDGLTPVVPLSIGVTVNALNTAPTTIITAPSSGSTYTAGDTITFGGSASDAEDGDLSNNLIWTTELGKVIGTGGSFTISQDIIEMHGWNTITATVTDSGGLNPTSPAIVLIYTEATM